MIKFVYRLIPVPIVKGKGRFVGQSYGFFVRIHPDFSDNKGFIEHELCHVRQFYRTFGLHAILYFLSTKWRYKSELEAYKTQLSCSSYTAQRAATDLSTLYGLDVTYEEALKDLERGLLITDCGSGI